jgi:hypothetical protein
LRAQGGALWRQETTGPTDVDDAAWPYRIHVSVAVAHFLTSASGPSHESSLPGGAVITGPGRDARHTGDRRSALLVRVWLEDGPETFRARLTALDDDGEDAPHALTVAVASSPGEVVTAVGEWLDGFMRNHGDTEPANADT